MRRVVLTGGKLPHGDVLPYQAGRYRRDPVPHQPPPPRHHPATTPPPPRHHPAIPIWLDHVALKAVASDKRRRFETAEEFLLALERGASRPLTAPPATPLMQRDPTVLWKLLLGVSGVVNVLLVVWLLFLPR